MNKPKSEYFKKTNCFLVAFTLLTLLLSCVSKATGDPGSTSPTTSQVSKYTVTFNSKGGSDVTSQTIASNSPATAPTPPPTQKGATFDGWHTDSTTTTRFYFINLITSNITLYAKTLLVIPVAGVHQKEKLAGCIVKIANLTPNPDPASSYTNRIVM